MKYVARAFSQLTRIFGIGTETSDLSEIVNQTERISARLVIMAATVLAGLIIAGLIKDGGVNVVIWSVIGAFASAMLGGALGLLFGLPTAEAKRAIIVSSQAAAPAIPGATEKSSAAAQETAASAQQTSNAAVATQIQEDIDTGYRDSTSLEQIADWLTKIIVGLTLTQFAAWEDRFERLASNLTGAMAGNYQPSATCERLIAGLQGDDLLRVLDLPICRPSAIPGGIIIALFATTGFIVTYLWMRRYFILEMVMAKKQAKDLLAAKRREIETQREAAEQQKTIEAAREVNLAEQSPGRAAISDPEIDSILQRGLQTVVKDSKAHSALIKVSKRVANEPTDPVDPWRGKFGESATANGVRLDASVVALAGNPNFFDVDLCVHAETEKRKTDLFGSKVVYFLHPTFGGQPKISFFGSDGRAPLEFYAYGAFTVGAILEDGTELELNLATLESAPARFRAR